MKKSQVMKVSHRKIASEVPIRRMSAAYAQKRGPSSLAGQITGFEYS